MVASLLLAALLAVPHQSVPDPPRDVLRQVEGAVQGDSLATLRAHWLRRYQRDPADLEALFGLATVAIGAGDLSTAEVLHRRLTDAAVGEREYLAHGHLHLAGLLRGRGETAGADIGYSRARDLFRTLGDAVGEADALHGLAKVRLRTEGPRAALLLLDEAVLLPLDGAPSTLATVRCERARLRGYTGHADAHEEAEIGYRLARSGGDTAAELLCMRAVMPALSHAGAMDSLLRVVERAESISRESNQPAALVATLTWRAMVMRSEWRLDAARAALLEAVQVGESLGPYLGTGWALLELGQIYAEIGDQPSAKAYLARAVRLFEQHGERPGLADAHLLEANLALRAGEVARARALFERVLEWGDSTGTVHMLIGARYGLAAAAMRTRDWTTATAHLDTLERTQRDPAAAGLIVALDLARGIIAFRQNDLQTAERAFRQAISHTNGDARLHLLEAHTRLAQLLALRGDVPAAEAELRLMSDRLDDLRSSLAERELRLLAFQRHDLFGEPSGGWASTLAALVAAGRIEAAFELAERRRARDLLDQIARARAFRSSASNPIGDRGLAPQPPASATGVRRSIPDERTALLQFVTGGSGEPTVLFLLTRDRIAARLLPPIDSLEADRRRFLGLIEDGHDARRVGQRLGGALLDVAARALPSTITNLVIVPDDVLHQIPFDALVLEDGRYVLERYAVSLVPSATIAAELWSRTPSTRAPAILAFGDPRFSNESYTAEPLTELFRSAFDEEGGLPRLAASGREATQVARYAKQSEVRLRSRASAAYLLGTSLERFRVLHFATHARVDASAITRTALALAPGTGNDGFVSAADLAALTLEADLVVLSACRTAGGVVLSGEGIQGLSAPLLAAGARSVAATLWPIGDRQTVRLVDDFYRALADGLATGDALRVAKLEAMRRGAPPAVWASFTLVGDPHVRVPLQHPRRPWLAWATLLTTTLCLAVYGARRWKTPKGDRS